jgi:hypothetical protein
LTDPGTVLFIQRILVGFIATEDQQSGSVFVQVPIDLRKAHGYARIEIGAARSYLDAGSVWAQVK